MLTHLAQLLTYITGFGGLVVPLILWAFKKDRIVNMDIHGKSILNFQFSIILYSIISIPLIFLFGLGILTLVLIGLASVILPIINAIKASQNELPNYPFTIRFIS